MGAGGPHCTPVAHPAPRCFHQASSTKLAEEKYSKRYIKKIDVQTIKSECAIEERIAEMETGPDSPSMNLLLRVLKDKLLRPPSYVEYTILFVTLALNLLDSFTTLTFTLTGTGVELNPVLRHLITINPFLVYPFLLSMMIPILLFRFNQVVEYGLAFLLITIQLIASLNNIGLIISRYPPSFPSIGVDIQFFGFLTGLTYVGGYTLLICVQKRFNFISSIKMMSINYLLYLLSYFVLSMIPTLWMIIFT